MHTILMGKAFSKEVTEKETAVFLISCEDGRLMELAQDHVLCY
jgi:hypothetical protein